MAFFKKIFKGKPLKRIEIKAGTPKFKIRGSRTGGINAAIHPLRGLTFNTKHGLRVSKTFKGLTLGLQDGNSILRGRWSSKKGLINLNLSKSGFSWSTKSRFGTYNISNPNRSSFKYAGIQIRGKKASGLALIGSLFTIIPIFFELILRSIYGVFFLIQVFLVALLYFLQVLSTILSLVFNSFLFILIDIPKQLSEIKIASKNSEKYNDDKIDDNRSSLEINATRSNQKNEYKAEYDEISSLEKFFKFILSSLGWIFYLSSFFTITAMPLTFFGIMSLENNASINPSFYVIMSISSIFFFSMGLILTAPYKAIRKIKKLSLTVQN